MRNGGKNFRRPKWWAKFCSQYFAMKSRPQIRLNFVFQLVLLFLAYLGTAKVGLHIAPVSRFATVVWAPTGISLAALLLFGYRLWPAIALGAFVINYSIGAPWEIALCMATGNTLEAILGSWMIKQSADFQPH